MSTTTEEIEGPVPGAHLGLSWEPTAPYDDVVALVRRCEDHDLVSPLVPEAYLKYQFTPGPTTQVLAGFDMSGQLRAVACVRHSAQENPTAVALRAYIDPLWRGRGIGRAVLAWQDSQALDGLQDTVGVHRIGVTIPSNLVDRRRLYTAAGFSSQGRLIRYSRRLGDTPAGTPRVLEPVCQEPGVTIQALSEARAALEELPARPDDVFVSTALYGAEALECCADASRVALRHGAPVGAVFVHATSDGQGRPVGVIHEVLDAPDSVAHTLLESAIQELWRGGAHSVHLRLAPSAAARWEALAEDIGCRAGGTHLIYGIEWT